MNLQEERTLTRDCPAAVVPSGESITIPAGTTVSITHRLGGNFTILWAMGMAHISGENAAALGEETQGGISTSCAIEEQSGPPSEAAIREILKTVFDPEIPVNIVDLGLVYSLTVKDPENSGKYEVKILMTLTAPGCGMGHVIAEDAESKIMQVPGVSSAHVELVWDPPWHQDMISEEGKMQLGLI